MPATDRRYDHMREWLATMREGERRRVWFVRKDGAVRVYEIEMGSVFKTDAAGEPIIRNR